MILYKFLVGAILLMTGGLMLNLAMLGRKLAKEKAMTGVIHDPTINDHQFLGVLTLASTSLAFVVIEGLVHASPAPRPLHSWLYWTNVVSGLLFMGLLSAVLLKFNGKDYPHLHRWLVYPAFVLCLVALASGIPLLINLKLD